MDQLAEIQALILGLQPRQFYARLAYWRSDAGGAALDERVGGTRNAKMPHFDRTDLAILWAGRDYAAATRLVESAMGSGDRAKALRHLRFLAGLERTWLIPIEVANEAIQETANGEGSCRTCGVTKGEWDRKQKKNKRPRLFRLKAGECLNCYQETYRKRVAELAVIDPEPLEAAVGA